jgi:hypothetical protein
MFKILKKEKMNYFKELSIQYANKKLKYKNFNFFIMKQLTKIFVISSLFVSCKAVDDCECVKITTDGEYWRIVGSEMFKNQYGYEFDNSKYLDCLKKWKTYIDNQAEIHGNNVSEHPEYVNASAFFEDGCNGKIKTSVNQENNENQESDAIIKPYKNIISNKLSELGYDLQEITPFFDEVKNIDYFIVNCKKSGNIQNEKIYKIKVRAFLDGSVIIEDKLENFKEDEKKRIEKIKKYFNDESIDKIEFKESIINKLFYEVITHDLKGRTFKYKVVIENGEIRTTERYKIV